MLNLYLRFRAKARPAILWPLFGLVLIFNIFLLKPFFNDVDNPEIRVEIMDTKPFYNADIVYENFDKITPDILTKLRWNVFYDDLYVITYFFFYILLLIKLFDNSSKQKLLPGILWFPVLLSVFDMIENTMEYTLEVNYQTHMETLANIMGFMTLFKWLMALAVLLLIIYGAALKVFGKKTKAA